MGSDTPDDTEEEHAVHYITGLGNSLDQHQSVTFGQWIGEDLYGDLPDNDRGLTGDPLFLAGPHTI